jgi:hypothetical protein
MEIGHLRVVSHGSWIGGASLPITDDLSVLASSVFLI